MQVINLERKKNSETNNFEYKRSISTVKYQVLTRKYRLYPTEHQKEVFNWWFSKCDVIWNRLLEQYKKTPGKKPFLNI